MAVGVNGIAGTDYSAIIGQTQNTGLANQISNMKPSQATDDEMMKACKEFETYMVEQMYKAMEKTVMKADEEENDYMSYFGDMQIQQYAQMVSDQGKLGLAQKLYDSMKQQSMGISVEELHERETDNL